MSDGWDRSAKAWIADNSDGGDFGRKFVLDKPMLNRVRRGNFYNILDIGCGEGRFCRMLSKDGISTVGIDPTQELIEHAISMHPEGDYRIGKAESLDFVDESFDCVVSYLSFIDIPDIETAIAQMARVLRPSGSLIVANLNGFQTAAMPNGWRETNNGQSTFQFDNYLGERVDWVNWRGIKVRNWHRPMSTYFKLLLNHGFQLRFFDEPKPSGGDAAAVERYMRVPYFHVMEWYKS